MIQEINRRCFMSFLSLIVIFKEYCNILRFKSSKEGFVAFVDAIEDGVVILDLKDNGPVVLVSEFSNLALSPVEPVVLSALLGIHVFELDVVELALEVVFDKRSD